MLMPAIDYCKSNNINIQMIHSKVYYIKKGGGYPPWYELKGSVAFVDKEKLDFAINRKDMCMNHVQNPISGIYWYLRQYYSDSLIALKISVHSRKFKSLNSWMMWLSRDMWNLRDEDDFQFRTDWSMVEDFFRNGSIELYNIANKYGLRELE